MTPFFSIIIPVYNTELYLRECLDGVLTQTFTNWEAICVDDGSTDSSGAILDEYARRDSRFIVIHQGNGGGGAARNAGLEVAKGEWLVYADSDDIVSRDMLNDFAEAIKRFPQIDIARCCTVVFRDGEIPAWFGSGELSVLDMSTTIPDEVGMFGITEMAYRASRFRHLKFQYHKIGEDLIYTSKCFSIANGVARIDKGNYGYRIRNGSMAHRSDTPGHVREKIEFLMELSRNLDKGNKFIGRRLARGRINMWLEACASVILQNSTSEEWRITWEFWCDSLISMRSLSYLSFWQRLVVDILVASKSRFLAKILCAMPHKLKKIGLHR